MQGPAYRSKAKQEKKKNEATGQRGPFEIRTMASSTHFKTFLTFIFPTEANGHKIH